MVMDFFDLNNDKEIAKLQYMALVKEHGKILNESVLRNLILAAIQNKFQQEFPGNNALNAGVEQLNENIGKMETMLNKIKIKTPRELVWWDLKGYHPFLDPELLTGEDVNEFKTVAERYLLMLTQGTFDDDTMFRVPIQGAAQMLRTKIIQPLATLQRTRISFTQLLPMFLTTYELLVQARAWVKLELESQKQRNALRRMASYAFKDKVYVKLLEFVYAHTWRIPET